MFSRAPVKRYNDVASDTPGPNAYDPKERKKPIGAADVKADRFPKDKDAADLPGPGQYDLLKVNSSNAKVTNNKNKSTSGSKVKSGLVPSSSTESINSEVFRTPRGQIHAPPNTRSVIKVKRTTSNSSSVTSDPTSTPGGAVVNYKARCADLEEKVAKLQADLKEALKAGETAKEMEETIEALRDELGRRQTTLETRKAALDEVIRERDELEERWRRLWQGMPINFGPKRKTLLLLQREREKKK